MKAILRAGMTLAAALAAAPSVALAQAAPVSAQSPTSNSASPDTVGPAELQNFNLKGTVTRPADQAPVPAPARPQTAPVAPPVLPSRSKGLPTRTARPAPSPAAPSNNGPTSAPSAVAPPSVEVAPSVASPTPAPPSDATPVVDSAPAADPFALFRGLSVWPWIAAALALAGGGAFLLWRRRRREEFADGRFDLLVASTPEPELPAPAPEATRALEPVRAPTVSAPAPAPARAPARTPRSVGRTVASRLRPTIEIGFQPLRCIVEEEQVTIEFEVELFNAGAAPARAVLAEASLLNASATQDQDLAAFFANPQGVGERLDIIPPMKRIGFTSRVVAPRAAVQEYELAGRRSFVPVIAFNALYEWSGGGAQTSAAYLVGRETRTDKLGPLRLDQGAREHRTLAARTLPSALRT